MRPKNEPPGGESYRMAGMVKMPPRPVCSYWGWGWCWCWYGMQRQRHSDGSWNPRGVGMMVKECFSYDVGVGMMVGIGMLILWSWMLVSGGSVMCLIPRSTQSCQPCFRMSKTLPFALSVRCHGVTSLPSQMVRSGLSLALASYCWREWCQ